MHKGRLEAFSDGVIAIIITIMVLELRVPHEASLEALHQVWPTFLSYILSFLYLAIYWNNHHHLMQAVKHVNGAILWANMHLLFWLSLISFTTAWMGENHFATWPTAFYGANLLCAAIAYFILVRTLLARHGKESTLAKAIGNDFKGKISIIFYVAAIALAFINPYYGCIIYFIVAIMWLIPDRRIEKIIEE